MFLFCFSFFGWLWITICNQPGLSTLLSLSLISTFSICAVIYLTLAWEVMIVYIQGGTILNTQDSDCLLSCMWHHGCSLPPQRCAVSSLYRSDQIGCGSVAAWPTRSHKPIPPKRFKDKLNVIPCNKLGRPPYCVCVQLFIFIYMEIETATDPKHILTGQTDKRKTSVLVKLSQHLQLGDLLRVKCLTDRLREEFLNYIGWLRGNSAINKLHL